MRPLPRWTFARITLTAVVATAACGRAEVDLFAAQGQEIIGGAPTAPREHPAVGVLLTLYPNGRVDHDVCTATLIAPDLVITAGHCELREASDRLVFSLKRNVQANLGRSAPRDAVPVDLWLRHPGMRTDGSRVRQDLALAHLSEPMVGVLPATLLAPDEAQALGLGVPLELVGYGFSTFLVGSDNGAFHGLKLRGEAPVRAMEPGLLRVGGGGEAEAQACFGDSGGPAFVHTPQGPRLAAIVSAHWVDPYGNVAQPCTQGTWYTSIPDHAGWIGEAVAQMP